MTEAPRSQLYRLIEERLDGTLADYIAQRRPHWSWRDLAVDLESRTRIEISFESLRRWFGDREQVSA